MKTMVNTNSHLNTNFTPVIGVLCIDIAADLQKKYGNVYYSYIAASYVKYLESAGARVIPIWIKRSRSYYEYIMSKINGILIPGGAVSYDSKDNPPGLRNDYVQSFGYIFEIAKDLSEKGQNFPLWGTCLGFQLMFTHSAQRVDIRNWCRQMKCSLPVKFESDEVLGTSKLFANINNDLKLKMTKQPFGIYIHKRCITKQDLLEHKIDKHWKVLATNKDEDGLEFITLVEHKSLPFYGSQIHLERMVFEKFASKLNYHHCLECFDLTQYFAKFFIQQCQLNENRFINQQELSRHSIYNFPIVLNVDADKLIFRQFYLFKDDVDYPFGFGR